MVASQMSAFAGVIGGAAELPVDAEVLARALLVVDGGMQEDEATSSSRQLSLLRVRLAEECIVIVAPPGSRECG